MRKPNKRDEYSPIKKGNGGDPFQTFDRQFQNMPNRPYEMVASSTTASVEDERQRRAKSGRNVQAVALPRQVFIPDDAQSMNLRRTLAVPALTVGTIISFIAPQGAMTMFLKYVLFAGTQGAGFFTPKVNGARVLPFHGDPLNKYNMSVYSSTDPFVQLPEECVLQLQPKDVLTWEFTNTSGAPVTATVFAIGYVDMSTERLQGRTGG